MYVQLQNPQAPGDTAWFRHDRFGMCIHWGLYAMPARHEWIKTREFIPKEKYDLYFKHFNPDLYDPKEWPRDSEGNLVTWEACQTFSGSWGYYRDETSWKSPEMLIQMLVNTVALGGNLLMNVVPTSRGFFDYRAEAALKATQTG